MPANDYALSEYSLWLEPQGATRDSLKRIITDLALKTNSPVFEPHITLLGGITLPIEETMEKIKIFVRGKKRLQLSCEGLQASDTYYKSIFLGCEKTLALLDLNTEAQKLFLMSVEYRPHLSLLYSDADTAAKEKLMTGIRSDLPSGLSFEANSLSLWKCKGTADAWHSIVELPFIDS